MSRLSLVVYGVVPVSQRKVVPRCGNVVCVYVTHWKSVECMGLVVCGRALQRSVLVQICFGGVGHGAVLAGLSGVTFCTGTAMEGLVGSRSGNVL